MRKNLARLWIFISAFAPAAAANSVWSKQVQPLENYGLGAKNV